MTMELSDSGLPPVQRVVTGHDANGRAVFKSEDAEPTDDSVRRCQLPADLDDRHGSRRQQRRNRWPPPKPA
jgi:hypothetical protein